MQFRNGKPERFALAFRSGLSLHLHGDKVFGFSAYWLPSSQIAAQFFGRFSKLPILGRLVPQIIGPIHAGLPRHI
jgi:hypothetical protein